MADVPQEYVGSVIEKLGTRKGELKEMTPVGSAHAVCIFLVPSRGLFGYRNEFLTDTHGEGIMASVFDSYAPYKGEVHAPLDRLSHRVGDRARPSPTASGTRRSAASCSSAPGTPVYGGMIVGVSPKQEDIPVNVCKHEAPHRTPAPPARMRRCGSSRRDQMSLEQCLEFLADDELLEVTPKNLRLRKRILDHSQRMKNIHGKK